MASIKASIDLLWREDRLLFVIIAYFFYVYSWMFRVALRTFMDGAEFRWVTLFNTELLGEERRAFIAGNGVDGHFVIIQLLALFFCVLLFMMIRRPDRLCKLMLLAWSSLFLLQQITVATGLGTDYVMRADTLGIAIPFYLFGPAEQAVMVGLALAWTLRANHERLAITELGEARKKLLLGIGFSFVASFVMFRLGEHDGLSDKLGILTLYSSTILSVLALFSFQVTQEPDSQSPALQPTAEQLGN